MTLLLTPMKAAFITMTPLSCYENQIACVTRKDRNHFQINHIKMEQATNVHH